jgi:hypothetical protein
LTSVGDVIVSTRNYKNSRYHRGRTVFVALTYSQTSVMLITVINITAEQHSIFSFGSCITPDMIQITLPYGGYLQITMRTNQEFRTGDIIIENYGARAAYTAIFVSVAGCRVTICKIGFTLTAMSHELATKITYNLSTDIYIQYDR